jgi:GST-like protein
MADTFVVHGARGTGSVLVEAMLTLLELPFSVARASQKTNPMRQVPALILPSGEVMTESAAILIWLSETYGNGAFAPLPGDARRPAFLRWMSFISSQIYAHFWVLDGVSRIVSDKAAQAEVRQRLIDRLAHNWGVMESQTNAGPYVLGKMLTPLDLYVAVVSRWGSGRARLHEVAPRLGQVARRIDADPRLAKLWKTRMPVPKGWVG